MKLIRGIRGATTVEQDVEEEIIQETHALLLKMIEENDIEASMVASVFISATSDVTASFPAKALRKIQGWKYVPVMCMRELDVPQSLPRCIRIMLHVNTKTPQENINHIYLRDAVRLRVDLVK